MVNFRKGTLSLFPNYLTPTVLLYLFLRILGRLLGSNKETFLWQNGTARKKGRVTSQTGVACIRRSLASTGNWFFHSANSNLAEPVNYKITKRWNQGCRQKFSLCSYAESISVNCKRHGYDVLSLNWKTNILCYFCTDWMRAW